MSRRWWLAPLLVAAVGCGDGVEPPSAPEAPVAFDVATTPLAFRQVDAGYSSTCGITTDGIAYCWGSNSSGELGTGTILDRSMPVRVRGGHTFRQISAGEFHVCAVTHDDQAYCWGTNSSGQLGDGTTTERHQPVLVDGGHAFRAVSAGVFFTCGVTTGNVALCWGDNRFAQLGDGSLTQRVRPARVKGGLAFRQVSVGGDHACGVTTADAAYCWGINASGELGRGSAEGPETCSEHACSTRPRRVFGGLAFAAVAAGGGHSCGVTTGGAAHCWGLDSFGQLGTGGLSTEVCAFDVCRTRPVPVAGGLVFRAVNAGGFNTCGVTASNEGYCWGINQQAQLGIGTDEGPDQCNSGISCSGHPMALYGGRAFRAVTVGETHHACATNPKGLAFCWGANLNGELGVGTTEGPEFCAGHACSTRPIAVLPPKG
jgi:alpha-tubulin suppressor-like RCC1 family protein